MNLNDGISVIGSGDNQALRRNGGSYAYRIGFIIDIDKASSDFDTNNERIAFTK